MRDYVKTTEELLKDRGIPREKHDTLAENITSAPQLLKAENTYKLRRSQIWLDILEHNSISSIRLRLGQALSKQSFVVGNR